MLEVLLDQFAKRALALDMRLTFTPALRDFIAHKGTNLEYGARPLKRTIQKEIEDNMSEEMLKGNITPGDEVSVDVENDHVVFKKIV